MITTAELLGQLEQTHWHDDDTRLHEMLVDPDW